MKSSMKSNLFKFGDELSVRENFFLMKVLQRYWAYESRGEEEPFAYMTYAEKQTIFGRNQKQKIKKLVESGHIKELVIGESKWKKNISAYIPLKKQYTITKVNDKQIDLYYMDKENELLKLHYSVFKSICNAKIEIDTKSWRKCVQDGYSILKLRESKDKKILSGKKEPTSKKQYRLKMQLAYKQIQFWNHCSKREKYDLVSVDDFGNRFHSIFSRIPKIVRQNFVTILGEETCEIDLRQSQPTILAKILHELIGENSFSKAISNGEYIYDLLGNNREEGGKEFNYSVFGKGISKKFAKTFPDTLSTISFLKKESNESFKSYSGLARKLQQYESEIFSSIWAKIISKRIIFCPVHDSIIVRKKDYSTVHSIMEKELRKHFYYFELR